MSRLVLSSCAIATMDASGTFHRSGYVVIEDDRVVSIGSGDPPAADGGISNRVVKCEGLLITPGLVNSHHHLYQWLTRGLAVDANLFEWLTKLYPVWALMDAEMEAAAARAGLSALALSGCTATTDHHYVFPGSAGDLLEVEIEAARDVGLRFHPCRGSMDLGRSKGGLPPDEVVEDRDRILTATNDAIDRHHDDSFGSMVRIAVAPCSPFSVTRELMSDAVELARSREVRLHTHLAETVEEEEFCRERFGVRPVQYLDDLGWLGDDVWLAHCIHLSPAEIEVLGETGTGVAHCPTSNGRLGAGIAPVADLLAAHAPVGLGVDGAASNESGELAQEMHESLVFARLRGGPTALSPMGALSLATTGGARCLGRSDEIGSIEPGKLADLAAWKIDDLGHAGIEDPVAALVLGPMRRVHHLIVGGRFVVQSGELQTADEVTVAHELDKASRRLAGTGGDSRMKTRGSDTEVRTRTRGGIGESVVKPDALPKATGDFAFSSDLWAEGMLWGATLRSPYARARISSIDISEALVIPGVHAVLTHEDVPGRKTYGLEIPDQPVLAWDEVRYLGEPVAIVAADHPATARDAAQKIRVGYEVHVPMTDPEAAFLEDGPKLHPGGNVLRYLPIRRGDQEPAADVVVTGDYETQMQDQVFLGPESGLVVPGDDGGVDIYAATQWLHVDREQIARSLGLPEEKVRVNLAGVGGSFGGREDLSMQIHASMLALYTGRPVKIVYSREESFVGHVHRHPARMHMEHGATRDGRLVYVKARLLLDGGAYASSSTAVISNAACFSCGPYDVPNATVDAYVVYTNNPPCGAMRGFGANQACFAYESQMDKLAAALNMDPLELRFKNIVREGSVLVTGQPLTGTRAATDVLTELAEIPLPEPSPEIELHSLPGGFGNTTHGEGIVRGIGYALGFKNICYSEGFDDYSTAHVRLSANEGRCLAEVHTAAVEVGQGLNTVLAQIARTELGTEDVVVLPADTQVGSSGSSSASRQTWMSGGAVKAACDEVKARVQDRVTKRLGRDTGPITLEGGKVLSADLEVLASISEMLESAPIESTAVYHHHPTEPLDPETGQGNAHVAFAFAAHRAVVDVDTELGLVRVVEVATAQDVGKAINPLGVEGQIEGGIAMGLGYAVMEEIKVRDGRILNPSLTDYIIPTILDMPQVKSRMLELSEPLAPYGLRGVGEPPTIASAPAIVAAIRAASGRPLERLPVRPEDIVGLDRG